MAADGSITIDTSLDNSGFAKDSKELIQAIKDLTTQITNLGKTLHESFSGYTKTIQDAVNATAQMQTTAAQTQTSVSSVGATAQEASAGIQSGAEQAQSAMAQLDSEIKDTQATIDELCRSSSQPIIQLDEPKQKASALEKEIGALEKAVSGVRSSADKMLGKTTTPLENFRDKSNQTERALEKLRQKVEQVGQTKIPTEHYQWLETSIEKAETALNKMYERQIKMEDMKVDKQSGQWKSLQYDINKANAMVTEYRNEMAQMEADGSAFTSGTDTEAYQQMSAQLDEITGKLAQVNTEVNRAFEPPDTNAWGEVVTFTDQIRASVQRMGQACWNGIQRVGQAAVSMGNAVRHPLQTLNTGLGWVLTKARQAYAGLRQMASTVVHAALKKIGTAAKSAAKSLANMVKGGIVNGVKKLASNLFRVGAGAKSSSSGLKMGLKSMMKYGLGVRSVFALLNKLRRAMMEGMGNYAKFDPGFNAAVSQFVAALMQLRNAFVSAFAPVIEVVLPILTTLINAITETVNRIGMLISSLTGKNSFKKATKVQYDYAAAMNDSADATDDETEAAKEAQKQLAGFDDVEILKEDKDSGSKGKNGNNGGQDLGGFTDVPIENSMSDLAKKLKEAWEKADFTEIGRMVGEKLRDALESIPWPKIKKTLQKIAKCVATFLNGFLETPGLFSVIGKTIAEGINSAFEFVNSFVQNFHWDSLGYAVRDGLVGVFSNLDWGLIQVTFIGIGTGLGTALSAAFDNPEVWNGAFLTLTYGLNSLIYGIDAFLKSVNWFSLAANIATGLNTGLVNMDWTALGITCAGVVNSLFNLFNGFVSTTDWGLLGASIMQTIGAFFGSIEWGNVGEALSNTWIALFDFLSGALQEVDWEALPGDICNAIGEFLAGFDWSGFCKSLGGLLGSAFTALVQLGTGLWNTLLNFGKSVIEGGWQGMRDKIAGVGRWIKENILDPFIKGFKDAFGIHSPSKVMMPLGENIIEGVLQGIKAIWHIITDFFGGCGQAISNVWDGLTGWWENIGGNLVTGIWNGICDSWDWLCDSVGRLCSNLWNGFCKFWGINSPSRLMMEGGRYIGEGAAVGLERTTNDNLHAIQNLGHAMHQEAEKIEPISLQAGVQDSLSGLDSVLLNFSDKVVNAFDGMIAQLDALVSSPGFGVPAFAAGTIAPYGTGTSRRNSLEDALENFTANNDALTKDDLTAALSPVIEAIKNYAGTHLSDESVARAANRGNDSLGRRFRTKDK